MDFKKILKYLSITFLVLFLILSWLVNKGLLTNLDLNLTFALQQTLSRDWDFPFSILSVLGSFEITSLIWFGLLSYLLIKKWWKGVISSFLYILGIIIEVLSKVYIIQPEPPHLLFRGVIEFNFPSHLAASIITNFSYPSGHMLRTSFLVIFFILFIHFYCGSKRNSRLQSGEAHLKFKTKQYLHLTLLLVLILMFISRIYLGEHWFSDVLGGLLLGSSLGILSGITLLKNSKV